MIIILGSCLTISGRSDCMIIILGSCLTISGRSDCMIIILGFMPYNLWQE